LFGSPLQILQAELSNQQTPYSLLCDSSQRNKQRVHPDNWHLCGTTSESLPSRLKRLGYAVEHLDGQPVTRISEYGEVVARRMKS